MLTWQYIPHERPQRYAFSFLAHPLPATVHAPLETQDSSESHTLRLPSLVEAEDEICKDGNKQRSADQEGSDEEVEWFG